MTHPFRSIAITVLVASGLALGVGLVAQYLFGLRPCALCLIQRGPFAVAALLAGLALARPAAARTLTRLAALALLLNAAIATYHVGVEQHWWASAVCGADDPAPVAVGGLAQRMSRPVEARCDQPAWSVGGVSMAMANVPFSAGLGAAALVALRRRDRAARQ